MKAKKKMKKDIEEALKHEQEVSSDENPEPKTFADKDDNVPK